MALPMFSGAMPIPVSAPERTNRPPPSTLGGEFHRVGEEVEEDLLDLARVGVDPGQVGLEVGGEAEAGGLGPGLDQTLAGIVHGTDIDHFLTDLQLARLDLAEVEEVVDDLQEMGPAVQNVPGVLAVPGVPQRPEGLVLHDLGEADDGIERASQLMAHGGQEFRLRAIGGFGFPPESPLSVNGMLSIDAECHH
jgi:hypothetical protein